MKKHVSLFVLSIVVAAACFLASCGRGSSAAPTDPAIPASTLSFIMTDGCDDGYTVDLRFFDETDNLQWPANTSDAYALNYDNTYTYNLSCNTGDKICYGASDPNGYWGVGVLGTESCPDCCWTCENASEAIELMCTTSATDRAKLRPGTRLVQRIPSPTASLLPVPTVGPKLGGTTAALRAWTVPVRGATHCGKGNAPGVNGGAIPLHGEAGVRLMGDVALRRPTYMVGGIVNGDGNSG